MTRPDPLGVRCRTCGRDVGQACRTANRWLKPNVYGAKDTRPHVTRKRAAEKAREEKK